MKHPLLLDAVLVAAMLMASGVCPENLSQPSLPQAIAAPEITDEENENNKN